MRSEEGKQRFHAAFVSLPEYRNAAMFLCTGFLQFKRLHGMVDRKRHKLKFVIHDMSWVLLDIKK